MVDAWILKYGCELIIHLIHLVGVGVHQHTRPVYRVLVHFAETVYLVDILLRTIWILDK